MKVPRGSDLAGMVFGRLTVVKLDSQTGYIKRYACICECGNTRVVPRANLLNGSSKSCGCLRVDTTIARSTTHGRYYTPEYRVYKSMVNRCTNPNYHEYHLYGGRGITISEEFDTFEKFFAIVGPRPSEDHQLDRKDNEKGYTPENVHWATRSENARNKRNNVLVTYNGEEMTLIEAAEKSGIDYHALYYRYENGWTGEKLFSPTNKETA